MVSVEAVVALKWLWVCCVVS